MNFEDVQKIFTNRELASYFWLLSFILFVSFKENIRDSFKSVLKHFFNIKIVIPFSLMAIYYIASLKILNSLNLWDWGMLKDAILWFILSGSVILIKSATSSEEKDFFKNLTKKTLTLMVIFEFIINTHNFSLISEFFFVPFVTLVVILKEYSSHYDDYKDAEKVMSFLQATIGTIVIGLSIYNLSENLSRTSTFNQLKGFLFPIVSTILLLPFAYIIALYSTYDNIFCRLSMGREIRCFEKVKSKIYLLIVLNLRLTKLQSFYKRYSTDLMRVEKVSDLRKLYKNHP